MSEKNKKKKQTGLGLAIWLLLMLIIVIVALVKWEEIKENADKAGLTALVEKNIKKEDSQKKEVPKAEQKKDNPKDETVIKLNLKNSENSNKNSEPEKTQSIQTQTQQKTETVNSEKKAPESSNQTKKDETIKKTQTETVKNKQEVSKTVSEEMSQPKKNTANDAVKKVESSSITVASTLKTKIFFVSENVPIVRKEVVRNVKKDSPLLDSINTLLEGPTSAESNKGYRSLIPQGTRLLGVSVKNGVATINFSEEFQFNQFGSEGAMAQLMQIVYTACEFSTVDSVQILIEGQKRDYLTEGVWIGSPLTTKSFS